jgi:NAD(P)-dependent dehydrogenase (short-subunit alcohol dehydrogenase family)
MMVVPVWMVRMQDSSQGRLAEKTALVTGAAVGIGKAIVERFAEEGATVYIGDYKTRNPVDDENVEAIELDVSNENHWERAVNEITDRHGSLDVLVNNAAVISYDGVEEMSLERWEEDLAVNQTGAFLGMREVIPVMRENGGGSIINLSSIWGNAAVPGAAAYHATKGAVRNMTKNAAITYVDDNIRVNSIHPGIVHTPLTEAQGEEVNEVVIGNTPMDRMGEPREVAHGAVFLASDESSYMTGSELVIDGGYLAQ